MSTCYVVLGVPYDMLKRRFQTCPVSKIKHKHVKIGQKALGVPKLNS